VIRKRTPGRAELFGVATKALAARSIAGENEVAAGVSHSAGKAMNGKPIISIEGDGTDMFVVRNGVRIAKRRRDDNPGKRGTWTPLEPGVVVRDAPDMSYLEIEINGVRVH
jgi:hypothetical protein